MNDRFNVITGQNLQFLIREKRFTVSKFKHPNSQQKSIKRPQGKFPPHKYAIDKITTMGEYPLAPLPLEMYDVDIHGFHFVVLVGCRIEGIWYNNLGSEVIINATSEPGVLVGEYRTAVERELGAAGIYTMLKFLRKKCCH